MEQQEKTGSTQAAARSRRMRRIGVVVQAKMQKTVVVAVQRLVRHPLYRKTIRRTSTFMAHDEKGAKRGDTVRIVESRPLSKNKRWRVEEIVKPAMLVDADALPDLPEVEGGRS